MDLVLVFVAGVVVGALFHAWLRRQYADALTHVEKQSKSNEG